MASASKPNPARDLAVRVSVYRLVAILFVLVGILLFAYIYSTKIQGHFAAAMRDPYTILVFVFPFVPAAFLSWRATVCERKFNELMRKSQQQGSK